MKNKVALQTRFGTQVSANVSAGNKLFVPVIRYGTPIPAPASAAPVLSLPAQLEKYGVSAPAAVSATESSPVSEILSGTIIPALASVLLKKYALQANSGTGTNANVNALEFKSVHPPMSGVTQVAHVSADSNSPVHPDKDGTAQDAPASAHKLSNATIPKSGIPIPAAVHVLLAATIRPVPAATASPAQPELLGTILPAVLADQLVPLAMSVLKVIPGAPHSVDVFLAALLNHVSMATDGTTKPADVNAQLHSVEVSQEHLWESDQREPLKALHLE